LEDGTLRDAIAFVSTFPPRQCGIASFTSSLVAACEEHLDGRLRTLVVAMDSRRADYDYPEIVKQRIDQRARVEYGEAAQFLNFANVRALSLQHEFGIFGGPDGAYLLDLLRDVHCPVFTTFHTILQKPTDGQRAVMNELIQRSQRLVVMSRRGMRFLRDVYGAPWEKIRFIPHGVDQMPLVEPDAYKREFNLEGREVVLTFGLLSPGKGIEYMIRALPQVVARHPDLCYVVLGATHPEVRERQGESYRLHLQRIAADLGLERNVLFIGRFVEQHELCELLKATDVYVTPYLNHEQITSGTLAYALGAGKPIVSTRYWYAEELLDHGRGILVDFRDSDALAGAILELLDNPEKLWATRAHAYEYSRQMVWGEVARRYVDTFRETMSEVRGPAAVSEGSIRRLMPITGLPRPKLDHLVRMTDDTGLLQHAHHCVPDRSHGYTTDDNARALVVVTKYYNLFNDDVAERLMSTYLAFVRYAQREDGLFRNFLSYDRRFLEEVGSDDCYGRALWGLGYVICRGPDRYRSVATEMFEVSIKRHNVLRVLSPRGRAHTILGLYYYLQRFPEAHDIEGKIDALAQMNVELFRAHSDLDWLWFEPAITYDNAVLAQALFHAHETTGKREYLDVGVAALDFLIAKCRRRGEHFSLVGNKGWHHKGQEPAQFDQQPIDACGLVEACKAAFRVTEGRDYLLHMRRAFDWYLGVNDVGVPLYDFRSGGCWDGLTRNGPNQNQGAESMLCCLLALLTLTEIQTAVAPTDDPDS